MTVFLQLRSGNSGPVFVGENQNDTILWDETERKFFVGPSTPGTITTDNVENDSDVPGDTLTDALNNLAAEAGGGLPLTKEFWVDPGRSTSTEDGSIAQPCLTVNAAIALLLSAPGTVRLAAGDYSDQDVVIDSPVTIIAGERVSFASTALSSTATLENINTGPLTYDFAHLELRNCATGLISPAAGNIQLTAQSTIIDQITNTSNLDSFSLVDCDVLANTGGATGTMRAKNSTFGGDLNFNITDLQGCQVAGDVGGEGERVDLNECQVLGGATASEMTLNQSKIDGDVTITVVGDTEFLKTDSYSLTQIRRNGGTHSFSNVLITDRPFSQGVFVVPAILAGASADVTVSGAGSFGKPGDTLVCSLATSGPVPRLAGVGISSAWFEADGDLTVRFTGATAGGNQLVDFNILYNESP